jgi:hypothetical protein
MQLTPTFLRRFTALLLGGQILMLSAALPAATPQGACADTCLLGAQTPIGTCTLWDSAAQQWIATPADGHGQMHNRARAYLPWLREKLMPAGGVMSAIFTDANYEQVFSYGGERDAAIWTGAYLAAEALRLMSTGAEDAFEQVQESAETLHRWWNIPGDPGYLARFAAPSDSAPEILATLPADDPEVFIGWPYAEQSWDWRGDVSRDQYQGVLLGYSLAYEALAAWQDDPLRGERARATMEKLRADTVEFAEQLMQRERRQVEIVFPSWNLRFRMTLENVIYQEAAMPDGIPRLEIDVENAEVSGQGVLVFWPNPTEYLRQLPGLGWLPDVPLATQALQLGAAFRIALQMSANNPDYAERHQALADYYGAKADEWLQIAARWRDLNQCGDGYHGLNIGFMPLYSWAHLETDPQWQESLRRDILAERLWPAVAADKNVFFAFIYASLMSEGVPEGVPEDTPDLQAVIDTHVAQLDGFPLPPNQARPVDLLGIYPESTRCPDLAAEAIDVADRVPATFIWERQPWKLQDPGVPNRLYGGVDYLLAYWLGRHHGFIAEDAPGTCLQPKPE